jgi:CelD/BcsL family acetyltransferase involved in cellulose biosynthesis
METESVSLPLRLGEFTLGTSRLQLSIDNTHFLDSRTQEHPTVTAGSDGHLIRSYPIDTRLPRFALRHGYLRYVPRQYQRHYIDLTVGWDAYQKQFSSKSRQTLRRKLKRFAQESDNGSIDWRQYIRPDEMEGFHQLARQVSSTTYQERLLDAGIPDDRDFLEGMKQLASEDRVRAFLLFLKGEPVAYLYCPATDGVLFYEYLGYTPDSARLSPGTVLQWLALESLFKEDQFRIFDFTAGDGAHKEYFGSHHQTCADVYYIRPGLKPLTVTLNHALVTGLSDLTTWIMDRLGIKARIKRLLRRG